MNSSTCPMHATHASLPGPDAADLAFFREAAAAGVLAETAAQRHLTCRRQAEEGGVVALTKEELVFGGRVAWRNNARCIGRLFWRSLLVRDCRDVADSPGVYTALCEHLTLATRGGDIRPVMTVFAPADAGRRAPRIRNDQLAGYAGYAQGGAVLGDPKNVALTAEAITLGWVPPRVRTAFDLLPWIIVGRDERPAVFPVPAGLVREVELSHPTLPWFAELALKWYAVPVVCDLALHVAGAEFPFAPFSGWYMGTEIGSRNLGDEARYNLLPVVARRMGLDLTTPSGLWKDRALIELNAAVLHSFAAAGCRIVDHHTASQEFIRFCTMEEQAGRPVSAEWEWIVPPLSSSATPVFHRPMRDLQLQPALCRAGTSGVI